MSEGRRINGEFHSAKEVRNLEMTPVGQLDERIGVEELLLTPIDVDEESLNGLIEASKKLL